MGKRRLLVVLAAVCSLAWVTAWADGVPRAASGLFQVAITPSNGSAPSSGRLLLFAAPVATARAMSRDGKIDAVRESPLDPDAVHIAAMEVAALKAGQPIRFDADRLAFPGPFSSLPAGDYVLQAVLDVNHDYAYANRGPGDWVSEVVELKWPTSAPPVLHLTRELPAYPDPWQVSDSVTDTALRANVAAAHKASRAIDFISPALSDFMGRPVHMRGWVVLPPGYETHVNSRYPVVYFTHGFGGSLRSLVRRAVAVHADMASGAMPPMIWVLLDESGPTGTHEFADSVNNGPWGQALTTELIPYLEAHYRMDAKPSGRFLQGHSSGGWATLWLQVRYPKVFGGTWSTAPDPSDFHDFTGVDIYAPDANVYRRADGSVRPLVRFDGKVVASFEQFARQEQVEGAYGGQMSSFDWVFSPRGPDGRPLPLFDRSTGAVDPLVAAYWREHYDIAHRLANQWPTLKADLDGKIHLIVGTADTFYLDGAAHRLKAVLDQLGAKAEVRFIPDRSHFDLYQIGDDRQGLLKQIAWQMYHLARPTAALPRAVGQ
ncbi:MAG TPA: alpha/beta hydrolase-fold protein [Rhodanobacteraceae bacterium]|nr:alpha/beta hydrolase-fold protein [Rhodanobacteraceae bacterium]